MTDFNQIAAPASASGPDDERPVSISARLGRLQFHRSGKFRVLQLADIQDGPKVSKDTIRLIEASLDAARPDVVIFTGNQIAGYDDAYRDTFRKRQWEPARRGKIERTRAKVRAGISAFLQPLIDRGIPFAVTYGNHDAQCGLSRPSWTRCTVSSRDASTRRAIWTIPPRIPASWCVRCRHPVCRISQWPHASPGTFAMPVLDQDRQRAVLGLVVLNSGDYAREGGYGRPSDAALRFVHDVPRWLGVRSLVFQHMPLPQYYDVLKAMPANADNAIQGYRKYDAQYYVLDDDRTLPGGYLGEGVSCPDEDCGEFAALRDTDGYIGVVVGHDHRNGFVGSLNGMMLVATPTCGFGSYGPAAANRAARLFEFDIRHPYSPRTQLLTFGELVGKPSSNKAYTYAVEGQSNAADGVNLLRKPGLLAGVAAALKKI